MRRIYESPAAGGIVAICNCIYGNPAAGGAVVFSERIYGSPATVGVTHAVQQPSFRETASFFAVTGEKNRTIGNKGQQTRKQNHEKGNNGAALNETYKNYYERIKTQQS